LKTSHSILDELRSRINRVRIKQNRTDLLTGALLVASGTLLAAIIVVLAEMLVDFPRSGRTAIALIAALSFVVAVSWFILRPLLRLLGMLPSADDAAIARRVGANFPQIKDRFLNALQLAENIASWATHYSVQLIEASLAEFSKEIQSFKLTEAVRTSHIHRCRLWLLATFCGALVFVGAFPGTTTGAAYRILHFNRDFTPPPRYRFEVSPGNAEIVKGTNVDIRIKVIALAPAITRGPDELTIVRRQEDQEAAEELKAWPDSSGVYRTTFQTVRSTTEYYARLSDAESDRFTLTVLNRPIIRSFRLQLEYPKYSGIPVKLQDEFVGDVAALLGTRIVVNGSASKPLRRAEMIFNDATRISLAVRNERFSASFPLLADREYAISVTDVEGLTNSDPVRYQLKAVPDEFPTIAILEPGRNVDIASSQSINLLLHANDDFGFTSLRLGYRLSASRYEQAQTEFFFLAIPLAAGGTKEVEIPYLWDLTGMHLAPEDVVEYYAEVFDNDAIRGPKSGKSRLYLLRLPSLEEVFSDIDKAHEQTIDDLQQSMEQAKKLKEDIESINRDLKKNKDPDWQTQKKMEEMAKRYQDVQKKLDNVQSRIEQMTQHMQQQNVLSKETLEKYLELQHLFQQLNATELQKTLLQLQQQMPNISKEQLQRAMQNMTFSEERFRQSIERTMNLLKRMQIEQKLDEVKKRAQELEKAQKDLQEEAAKAAYDAARQQELAKQQADLAAKERAMEREAADLQRKMEEFFTEMPADQLQKLVEQLRQQQLDRKMQQAGKQMQSGNMLQAGQMQQQIGQQLSQFSDQISAMQKQMLQQQAQHVMNELRKATANLLELSKDEEALKQQSQSAPANSSQLRQNAEGQQQAIQDLQNITSALAELSQKSFVITPEMGKAIGEALAKMHNALQDLEMRNGSTASQEQEQAMAALNRAAIQVQGAMQAMMRGGGSGAGSLMQQLQMMASQQMAINVQTQQIGGNPEQQAIEAARLAAGQEAIRKSLEQLNREAQQSGEQQRILGDLNKIAEEMKEVVHNLEHNEINPETTRKQERILSRLLDASKSVRERDFEKKRRAETGTQIARQGPKDLDLNSLEGKSLLREELLKALEQGYSKDYQELIRKYFEELEKTEDLKK
jgi:hypothetical protein